MTDILSRLAGGEGRDLYCDRSKGVGPQPVLEGAAQLRTLSSPAVVYASLRSSQVGGLVNPCRCSGHACLRPYYSAVFLTFLVILCSHTTQQDSLVNFFAQSLHVSIAADCTVRQGQSLIATRDRFEGASF
jgi:hypothetical protein